jgi:hypothetical protein
MSDGVLHHTSLSPGQDMPAGGSWHVVCEVTENLRGLSLGELCAVEINANLDAAIGGARESLQDRPVRQDIGGHVDFVVGAIDKHNVDMFEAAKAQSAPALPHASITVIS